MITWEDVCPYCRCAMRLENVDDGYIVRHGDDDSRFYRGLRVFYDGWFDWTTHLHPDMRELSIREALAVRA